MQDQQLGRLIEIKGPIGEIPIAHDRMHVSQVRNRTQDLQDPGVAHITQKTDCRSGCVHAVLVRFPDDRVISLTEREQAGNCEQVSGPTLRKVRRSQEKLYPNAASLT